MAASIMRLRFTDFLADPDDPDVMRRALDMEADVMTFEGVSVTFWLAGVEVCSYPVEVLVSVETQGALASVDSRKYTVEGVRQHHPKAYQRWSPEDDERLLDMRDTGSTVKELAERFGRQPSAIRSRIDKLGSEGEVSGVTPPVSQQPDVPPF
ncbi:hypothetical protein ACIOJD_17055 [Streptomyces sp. NPDC088116]|uniref:hypothetical protein n=1 Tax=Streptomyces sp. NPDC088116 TaxID=3365825 RepID=UPI0038187A55